jgi:hypothetical protein
LGLTLNTLVGFITRPLPCTTHTTRGVSSWRSNHSQGSAPIPT